MNDQRGSILLEALVALLCTSLIIGATYPIWRFINRSQSPSGLANIQSVIPLLANDVLEQASCHVVGGVLRLETLVNNQVQSRTLYTIAGGQITRQKNGGYERILVGLDTGSFRVANGVLTSELVIDQKSYQWQMACPGKK